MLGSHQDCADLACSLCAVPMYNVSPSLLPQVAGVTALACGMISVGSCNGDVTSTILQTIMEKSETELKDTYARWLPLGLGLNHLGEAGQCQHLMVWGTGWRDCSTAVL